MAKTISKNNKFFKEAKRYLVGGVNSPVRSFKYVGGKPILIKKGKGAHVFDYDNKRYIDYVFSWGALILGHAHPRVINGIKKTVGSGLSFGATTKSEIELAKLISDAVPFIEKIRFVNSGTEAVMSALRLARGYTKRELILKFKNSYHGHADSLLAKSGSGLSTFNIPLSKGVPKDFIKNTLIVPFGDFEYLGRIFKRYGKNIAAVIVEPVGANHGVIQPQPEFLKTLRIVTKKYKTILIFDEVITGFRFRYGLVAQEFGIEPDLVVLGKIIGGGLPIGAYGGAKEIMNHLSPIGEVYQASTFAGNPVVMQSGISTLKELRKVKGEYRRLKIRTEILASDIKQEAKNVGLAVEVSYCGPMFSLKFKINKQFSRFYAHMLKQGIYLAPSEFETNFLSFAHSAKDVENTKQAIKLALEETRNDS